jgi:hypothetical protein
VRCHNFQVYGLLAITIGDFFSREQRKKQRDWLATNTDVITTQSHSLFARKMLPNGKTGFNNEQFVY